MGNFVSVAKLSEIPEGGGKVVQAGKTAIAVFRVGGKVYAIGNRCPHAEFSLGEGDFNPQTLVVTCIGHGWEFNVTDGTCLTLDDEKVDVYEVALEGDDIKVAV